MSLDKDLQSIQEVRELLTKAKEAQLAFRAYSQKQVDTIVKAMVDAGYAQAERLGRMAHEETGFGKPEDKKKKNEFGTMRVWESIKDLKTVGVINEDKAKRIVEIGEPMGVVAVLTFQILATGCCDVHHPADGKWSGDILSVFPHVLPRSYP